MRRLVEYATGSAGETVVVEVEDDEPAGGERRAGLDSAVERAGESLDAALERVKPAATALLAVVRELADSPDEVAIEFGVKLTAKAGAVLASAAVEGNYKVMLTWKRA